MQFDVALRPRDAPDDSRRFGRRASWDGSVHRTAATRGLFHGFSVIAIAGVYGQQVVVDEQAASTPLLLGVRRDRFTGVLSSYGFNSVCAYRGINNFAIRPVHPVWCVAPTPRPVSPWKYS
jgi:hypothetical protein